MKISISNVIAAIFMVASITLLSSCDREAPTADFTYSVDGMDVTFAFTGDGDVDSYSWNFGDGSVSTSENPTHTYSSGGTYSVTLSVINTFGDDTETQSVEIGGSSGGTQQLAFGDADGALYAINTVTSMEQGGFSFDIELGTAVAWFGAPDAFESAGTVMWSQGSDNGTLDIQSNNSYLWTETGGTSSGFSGSITWDVSGENSTPAIDYINNNGFPSLDGVASETTVDGAEAYTLTHDGSISGADSIYFMVTGPNGSLLKRGANNQTSADFTASEMSTIGKGTAIFQITGFNIVFDDFGGRRIYFVNETVVSATGEIQ